MDNTFSNIQLRTKVLLCTYDAMLGMISPDVRLISIDWSVKHFYIMAFYDRVINDDDIDILKTITTEVAANFPGINDIKEYAEFSDKPFGEIKALKKMVFLRYGELDM